MKFQESLQLYIEYIRNLYVEEMQKQKLKYV